MFTKLWTLLQTHYQQSDFKNKMGNSDGQTAQVWIYEMSEASLVSDDIVNIAKNLRRLKNPEFIPNVFQLIQIAEEIKKEQQAARYPYANTLTFPTDAEVMALRDKTKPKRNNEFTKIRNILYNKTLDS